MSFIIRLFLLIPLLVLLSTLAQAQTTGTGTIDVPLLELPALNNDQLLERERALQRPGRPPEFAYTHTVHVRPETHGRWQTLSDGSLLWKHRIRSRGAHSLNFGFTEFYLPEASTFYLRSLSSGELAGPFTPADNELHNSLWTPVIPGDDVVLELRLPSKKFQDQVQLELSSVNHDFVGFSKVLSGSCNLDVICGSADGWGVVEPYRDIIRSVAVYSTGGKRFCSGFLINNTRNDGRPYFLTANHCEITRSNAPSLVVYWNFENSSCRPPDGTQSGLPGDGDLTVFNSGAIYRAGYSISDFTLLELDDDIHEDANAYFAGWNRQAFAPRDTVVGIHHPDAAEKRISFAFSDTYWANGIDNQPSSNGTHLVVPAWSIGTTEAGSSGSPLFDKQGRARGQLHGGLAACGRPDFDSYGSIRRSWTGGGLSSNRLSDWLDPDGTNLEVLDGREQGGLLLTADSLVKRACNESAFIFDILPDLINDPDGLITFRVADLPAGFEASFDQLQAGSGELVQLTIRASEAVPPGNYPLRVVADAGSRVTSLNLTLVLEDPIVSVTNILSPVPGSKDVLLQPELSWSSLGATNFYQLEVSRDQAFAEVVLRQEVREGTTVYAPENLERGVEYFWRVRGVNSCGAGPWSEVAAFTTGQISCPLLSARDLPLVIPSSGVSTQASTIEVVGEGTLEDLRLDLNIEHSWVGDLEAVLISPSGTMVRLFDRPGYPTESFGCSESNLNIYFSDQANLDAEELEFTCSRGENAIEGEFRPIDAFSVLRGEPTEGTWQLVVTDHDRTSGGIIRDWALDFCIDLSATTAVHDFDDRTIRLMPNPSPGPLVLEFLGTWDRHPLQVRLFDTGGRTLQSWQLDTLLGRQELYPNVPPGIYMVELQYDGIRRVERWVVMRP